jgi:glycosyltransferase involved in cell wall biosynthesis
VETVIAIPVWDHETQFQHTRRVVKDICGRSKGDFTLVVIDNASPNPLTADFLSLAASHFTNLHIISNEENVGYGPAINQAWEWGYREGAEFFVCLNNDIVITHPSWLETAFLMPLRVNPRQLIGARMIDFNPNCDFGRGIEPYLEGWALGVASCFLEDVGLFHPEMHAYYEDVEICIRARRRGFKTIESPAFEWRNDRGAPVSGPLLHLYGQTGFKEGMGWPNRWGEHSREVLVRDHYGTQTLDRGRNTVLENSLC